jgi:hypothetical protein
VIYEARHLKPGSQRPLRKASTGKHNGRHFSALHLFQCHLMRNEHLSTFRPNRLKISGPE